MAPKADLLLKPLKLGGIGELKNRIALAAMTRARTPGAEHIPNEMNLEYYCMRKSGGLILTEGTHISGSARGWCDVPGIYTDAQAEAWKKITDAVHADNGARMVCQLWHQGRQSCPELAEGPMGFIAPSAIAGSGNAHLADGTTIPFPVPRALDLGEIPQVVEEWRHAAKVAKKAGFAGVQIHAANGYIVDQFMQSCSNTRTDAYGGSLENRLRFCREVIDAVLESWPADCVGIKLSPNGVFGGMGSQDNFQTFEAAVKLAADKKLAFMEVMDGLAFGFHEKCEAVTLAHVKSWIRAVQGENPVTVVMANCGHTLESGEKAIAAGEAALVSFGRPYLSDPKLPEKFAAGEELAPMVEQKLWFTAGVGVEGYTKL